MLVQPQSDFKIRWFIHKYIQFEGKYGVFKSVLEIWLQGNWIKSFF